jgi:hypothetical protein
MPRHVENVPPQAGSSRLISLFAANSGVQFEHPL